jgi:Ankyrin repeats (3 copies)
VISLYFIFLPLHSFPFSLRAIFTYILSLLFYFTPVVDLADCMRWSPLHHAAFLGHTAAAGWLFKHSARLDLKDRTGNAPVDIAADNQNADCVTLLRIAQVWTAEDGDQEEGGWCVFIYIYICVCVFVCVCGLLMCGCTFVCWHLLLALAEPMACPNPLELYVHRCTFSLDLLISLFVFFLSLSLRILTSLFTHTHTHTHVQYSSR